MVGKVYRGIGRFVGYGAAFLALLVVALFVRLAAGPVDLDFLRSHFAQEVDTPAGKLKIGAEHIHVEWDGIEEPIRLVFNELRVTNEAQQTVATAPSFALSFEPGTLLRAHFLPTAIEVDRPTLDADIAREGGMLQRILAKTDSSSQGEVVNLLIEQLLAQPNYATLLGQLDTVIVKRAHVTVRDMPSGMVWDAPNLQARLNRDESGVIISAGGRFNNGSGPVDVALSGIYSRDRSRISVEARLEGLKPSTLAGLASDGALLRGIDLPLSGRLRIEADGGGNIHTVAAEMSGGAGTLALPGVLANPQSVRSMSAAAHLDADAHTAKIDHIHVDLGGAVLSVTGSGSHTAEGQNFTGRAELRQIPVDKLGDYWPLVFAEGGRQWAIENLKHGALDIAADFALSAPADDVSQLKVDRLVASFDYRGMTLRYMPQMPELTGVSGTARFENGTLHFDLAHGAGAGLTVTAATIDLVDLDKPSPQTATLHVPITGTAAAALALLARPRLGLSKDVLFDPKRVGGNVSIDLSLSFPILNSVTFADLDIRADAMLSRFSLKGALGDVDLTETTAHMIYGDQQLVTTGSGKLDGGAIELAWREHFGPKVPFRRRYELKGAVPAAAIAKAGFAFAEPFVTGPIGITNLTYQVASNGAGEVRGRFDLKGAKASVPQLSWTKDAGVDGLLNLDVKLASGGKLVSVDADVRGGGILAKGTARFSDDSAVQQVTLNQLVLGRTDVAIDWRRRSGGVDIDVRGRSLELSKVRQALKERDESAKKTPGGAAQKSRDSTRVSVNLAQLLVQRGSLGALTGRFEMSGDRIASADIGLAAGRTSTLRIQPGAGARNVVFYVADFGQMLREAGWLDGFVGRYLSFNGRFDDTAAESPLVGTLKLGPYRLEKVTPRKDVDSLNSTIDGLNRAGNALQQFDGLEAEIVKTGERIDVKNGRTSGKSIGLTTAGYLDLATDTARLRGVVVPGFEFNNLLSNVPLLGPLITGGKDAGIIAISYKLEGPFDDLKSDINLLSVAAPGVLRDLFNGSGTGGDAPADKRKP